MTAQKKKYDVGILGWWYGKNYGSILTYYGLNRAIVDLGYSVLMVHETLGYNGWRVSWPDDIISMNFARRMGYNTTKQQHYSKMPALNDEAEAFVVGSDQLWNPLIGRVNDDLFLDFVGPENKRVAYSTSFGNRSTGKFKPEFIEKQTQNLKKFDAISVREGYAVNIAKEVFGVEAQQMIDPVFLLPKENYEALADQATTKMDGDYLAVFYLDPNPEKRRVAEALAQKLGLRKIVVIPNPDGGKGMSQKVFEGADVTILEEDSPENFLSAYKNSRYVITDSFHGTAFAVMFQKPFSSIYNTHRGIDRFKNLLGLLGFGDSRRVLETDTAEIIAQNKNISFDVPFSVAQKNIDTERKRALIWLKEALAPKGKTRAAGASSAVAAKGAVAVPGRDVARQAKAATRKAMQSDFLTLSLRKVKWAATRLVQRARPLKSSGSVSRPQFVANNACWTSYAASDSTRLLVEMGAGEKGNLIWTEAPVALEKGARYRLSMSWSLRTSANVVTLNLRNAENKVFQAIGHIAVGEKRNIRRTDVVDFVAPYGGAVQIMLGASQFTGAEPGADVFEIALSKLVTTAGKAPEEVVDLAVPVKMRSMEKILEDVRTDPRVTAWQRLVEQAVPDAGLLLGAEMKAYTYNKVGGPADLIAFPKTIDAFKQLLAVSAQHRIPVTVLGLCTNVLVRDGGLRGLVISTKHLDGMTLQGDRFTASCGAGLTEAAFFLMEHGKACLEWAAGIPGTIGGAVFMNAGTNISDMRRSLESVTFIDGNLNLSTLNVAEISWGKRYSSFQDRKDWIVLQASFRVTNGDKESLRKEMMQTINKRASHFPLDLPNHGSTFKWWRAPRLISQSGLVGVKIGGAQVSTKQPGFFVNLGSATASDYEALINLTIAKVYEKSGFLMEPEVEIIGERPHRYERYAQSAQQPGLDQR